MVSRSIVTGPPVRAAARPAGNSDTIRPVTAARPGLYRPPLRRGDPPGQARGGRRGQPRHGGDLLACRIGALAVQPGQEVLSGQLRRRDPGQQLPGAKAAVPLLDRPGHSIDRLNHTQPVTKLTGRGQPRVRRQRPIWRADPWLLPLRFPAAYPAHQIGASPAGTIITSQRSSSQARAAPIGI